MEINSVLAQSAYTYGTHQDADKTLREIESYGLEGYKIDDDLSDDESVVLLNDQQNELTLSIRGTDPTKLKDLYSDLQIFGGMPFGERFYGETLKLNKIMSKYPNHTVKTTGHSLGGHISYNLARTFNIEGHHFNAGAGVFESMNNIKSIYTCGDECEKQYFYTTGRDPLSVLNMHRLIDHFGKQQVQFNYRQGGDFLNHGLYHFLPPKKGKVVSHHTPRTRDFCVDNPKDKRCSLRRHRNGRI